ncbi:hypothetical protein SUDANB176_05880 [Streptomyces sp. enrichment culture]
MISADDLPTSSCSRSADTTSWNFGVKPIRSPRQAARSTSKPRSVCPLWRLKPGWSFLPPMKTVPVRGLSSDLPPVPPAGRGGERQQGGRRDPRAPVNRGAAGERAARSVRHDGHGGFPKHPGAPRRRTGSVRSPARRWSRTDSLTSVVPRPRAKANSVPGAPARTRSGPAPALRVTVNSLPGAHTGAAGSCGATAKAMLSRGFGSSTPPGGGSPGGGARALLVPVPATWTAGGGRAPCSRVPPGASTTPYGCSPGGGRPSCAGAGAGPSPPSRTGAGGPSSGAG